MNLNEWCHHGKPPFNRRAEVWTNGEVRTGRLDGLYFLFDDCTDQRQNRVLAIDRINAWRLAQ